MRNIAIRLKLLAPSFLSALAFALFLLHPRISLALDPEKTLFQYNCRTWTRQNGLPADGVTSLAQTRDGYIWLGTARGLMSFDGIEFQLLDPGQSQSPVITGLSRAKKGGLWFGLERGSFGFCDGKTVSVLGKPDWGGTSLNVHSVLEATNGDLWVAAETQLARLRHGEDYEAILTTMAYGATDRYDVLSLYEDTRGRIWVGTAHRGLLYWQNGVMTPFPDHLLDTLEISSVVEDENGDIWIGTNWGLLCYDANLKRKEFPFPWYPIRTLFVDHVGTLWIGTIGNGLMRYQQGGTTELRKQDGLPDDVVTALMEDQEGSLWVGTRNGLSQLSDVKIPTFGKKEGLTAEVSSDVCASKDGGLWIGSGEGFTYFDAQGRVSQSGLGLSNNYITRVFEAKNGNICVVNAYRDLQIFSGGDELARFKNAKLPTAITEDSSSVIVSLEGDISRLGTNGLEPYAWLPGQKPSLGWIWNMAVSHDDAIWIASDNGVCRAKDGAVTMWQRGTNFPDAQATWVCEDADGYMWAGLDKGIARFKDGKIQVFTMEQGLFDNIIYAIVPDNRSNLWVHSSRGFFSVKRQALNDYAEGKLKRIPCVPYNGLDGAKSAERFALEFAGCKTTDGRVWFPTAQGIVMIDPTRIMPNFIPPRIYLKSVRADGRWLKNTYSAVVKPGKGELEFNYAGLSYIAPLGVQYRYRLHGYDRDWVDAGTRRSAFYMNLNPGAYRFEVQACNQDKVWNSVGASMDLALQPHFYQTTWFTALSGVTILAALFGLYGWRLAALKSKQKKLQETSELLEAKVAERTSELQQQVEERKRMQTEMERIHSDLVIASRHAGQAEVASSVLHNVGNVLNSVNISANVVSDQIRASEAARVTKIADLLAEHRNDLAEFLNANGRSEQVITYLKTLSERVTAEQGRMIKELESLTSNIDHIKGIVAMQQSYAQVSGVMEMQSAPAMMEDALRINSTALERHHVRVVRDFDEMPNILVDRHKVLQILVNLISNAKHAVSKAGLPDKLLTLGVKLNGDDMIHLSVTDNGVGIPPENLKRIFMHGFTTRKDGHGFGLHSGSLSAQEMGGTLDVYSAGVGHGSTFTLLLPKQPKR